jgi:hypothetical protein
MVTVEKPRALSTALKEWAVVCRALGEGRQSLLLRKGGIIERTDGFALESPWFLFLPTLEHQNAGDVTDPLEGAAGGPPEGPFPVDSMAFASDVRPVRNLEALKRLMPSTVHTERFLEKRWSYRPDRPLYAVLTRVFRRGRPLLVPPDVRYAGCVSWVELSSSIETDGFSPVLEDEIFASRRQKLLEILT